MGVVLPISPQVDLTDEQRDFDRVRTALPGTLFTTDGASYSCSVLDISQGGARIICSHSPPLETLAALYVEGFGRFDCLVIRDTDGEIGLFFVCDDAKHLQTQGRLKRFVETGKLPPTRLRRHARAAANAFGFFARANGYLEECHIIDMSLQGMSIKTQARPPIGEILNLGGAHGRVVRHHDQGIAVQFLRLAAEGPLPG